MLCGGLLREGVPGGALAQGAQEPLQVPGWNQEGPALRAQEGDLQNHVKESMTQLEDNDWLESLKRQRRQKEE